MLFAAVVLAVVAAVPQMPDGSLCHTVMYDGRQESMRIYGLPLQASEEAKNRALAFWIDNALTRLKLGGGSMSAERRMCKEGCGGTGGVKYPGLWNDYFGGCELCEGNNCSTTCYPSAKYPCPPPCP